ncbi:13602_t:CDS:2 [Ambispora leptoticha]|uniref:13602_t:CDS:1 n=1 Tax=Ambispora leptoticha TaxID=144679 RepID=A0A9N9A1W7_9GLOM|nr:13602_t:CDS:2 [Ambispora leptoticha]
MSRQDRIQQIQQQTEAFVNTPALRPISSPMTPITPLVLGDSSEKDVFVMHAAKQYHNSELQKQPPDYSSTQSPHSPSPFSSGASTPTLAHVCSNTSSRPKSCPSSPILSGIAYNGSMMMMTGIGGSFASGQYNNMRVMPSLYDQFEIAKRKGRENAEQAQLQDLMSRMDIRDSN